MASEPVATFTVDLPDNEGALDFEFRTASGGSTGTLRVIHVNGEAAGGDVPTWILARAR